jgi:hypothetical protein
MKTIETIKRIIIGVLLVTMFGFGLVMLFAETNDRVALSLIDFIGLKVISFMFLFISYKGFKDMRMI